MTALPNVGASPLKLTSVIQFYHFIQTHWSNMHQHCSAAGIVDFPSREIILQSPIYKIFGGGCLC